MKKILRMLLVLCMVLTTMPLSVAAEEVYTEISNFDDLQNAINSATGDLNLKLSDSYTITPGTLTIPASYNITIDLNGKSLDGGSDPAIRKESRARLTITGNGTVTSACDNTNGGTIYLMAGTASDTVLEITGGTIENTADNGTAIYNKASGKITIPSGSPVITGGDMAMNVAPDLSSYAYVMVTAKDRYGSASYGARKIKEFKYLEFKQGNESNTFAKIGEQGYTSLQLALEAVKDGQTIQLVKSSYIDPVHTVYNSNNFILDLNGKTLLFPSNGINHNGSGILTITDSSEGATGKVSVNSKAPAARIDGTGTMSITGGTIENTGNGDAIAILGSNGKVSVTGGIVKSNGGPAIWNRGVGKITIGGTATITSKNEITEPKPATYTYPGTIYLESGSSGNTVLEITGGTIENTADNGIAIYNKASGKITIPSGSPVIWGKGMAMNKAPDFSGYTKVQITASENHDGSLEAEYKSGYIGTYRYLEFEQSTGTSVSNLSLTDKLSKPVIGGIPETAFTDEQYDGAVCWSGNPDKFLDSTAYTATVVLEAKSNYTFSGVAQDTITHAGARSITHEMGTGKVLTVTIEFPETAERALQKIEITKAPDKTEYQLGDTFSTEGMVVKATYNDGTEDTKFTDYSVDKTGALTMSDTTITLTAKGTSVTTTQNIIIKKADGPAVTGVTVEGCTTADNNDGKLIGVTTAMEYKKFKDTYYTSVSGSAITVSGSAITGLTNGDYLVRVAETDTHSAGEDSVFTVAAFMAPTYTISGTISDSETNSGIAGASVQLKSGSSNIGSAVYTDSNGTYTITDVPTDIYTIEVSASGYNSRTTNGFDVSNANITGMDLSLTKIVTFIPVTDITMTNTATVQAGTNLTLVGTITPGDATNRTIIWSVENANDTGAIITGNTFRATSAGTATVKATVANGLTTSSDYTKTFTITVTAAPAPVPNPGPTPGSGSSPTNTEKPEGIVEKSKQQEDGAPAVNINSSSDELKTRALTPQEQELVARGENAKILLKVTDISTSISDEEKKLIQDKLAAENGAVENRASDIPAMYVDLTLYKQVGNREQIKVTETNGKINISIDVPEEFWNTDITKSRTFYVIRIHDGVAIRVDGTYDPVTHLFTFETDRFSTYALTYQDTSRIQTYKDFHHLQLTAKAGKTSQTLSYKKAANVDGYLIYGGKCGEEMKELAKLPADTTSYTIKNLKEGTSYKFQVKAYRIIDGEQVVIMTSKVVHSITESKKYGNPTKVTSNTASVKLAAGKSKIVTCQVVLPNGKKLKEHTAVIRYESSNKEVATVNSKGKIRAKAKGSCYVYAYAQNGVYKKIKVTVE